MMPNYGFKKMLDVTKTFSHPVDDDLNDLAKNMALPRERENSKIPAGYTYLAQFVDHDISLDSASDKFPWQSGIALNSIFNKRNPTFDLETIYGIDAAPNGNTVVRADLLEPDSPFLKIGKTSFDIASKIQKTLENDLPRRPNRMAVLVDKRNDENLLVAQTHVAFIKFHNAIASKLEGSDPIERFEEARRLTIRYYQHIVVNDLLPQIVKDDVLNKVKAAPNTFYNPKNNNMFMPLEFSLAAFRMGHSMIRNKYNLNSVQGSTRLNSLQTFTGRGGMMGKNALPSDWVIDWNLFYDIDNSQQRDEFNFALKINTQISSALGNFGPSIGFNRMFSVPALDLYRGRLFELPPGQMIEQEFTGKEPALHSDLIAGLLPEGLKTVLHDKTPLWFYILAEAEREAELNEEATTLGSIGSLIVAETLIALILESEPSILKASLTKGEKEFIGVKDDGKLGMPEMLKFIESENPGFLNPVEA
jgi:hypothetical protein